MSFHDRVLRRLEAAFAPKADDFVEKSQAKEGFLDAFLMVRRPGEKHQESLSCTNFGTTGCVDRQTEA